MENLSVKEFALALSGSDAVPGGGGASAAAGAYGCALGMMSCALTHGKKRYAVYEDDLCRIEQELARCRDGLLACIQEDADCFLPLSKAYGLPKETQEQRQEKEKVLEKALYQASLPPMKLLEYTARAMNLLLELSEKCSRLSVSDVGTGASLLEGAARGGLINVQANTRLMKDLGCAQSLDRKALALRDTAIRAAEQIYRSAAQPKRR